jgi:hypothetical protein
MTSLLCAFPETHEKDEPHVFHVLPQLTNGGAQRRNTHVEAFAVRF